MIAFVFTQVMLIENGYLYYLSQIKVFVIQLFFYLNVC